MVSTEPDWNRIELVRVHRIVVLSDVWLHICERLGSIRV